MADHRAETGNAAQIEFWNSAATRAWADQYARMDRAVAALTKELLDLAAPQPGERALDIGCGPTRQFLSWRGASIRAVMCLAQMSPSHRSRGHANGSLLPGCGTRRLSSPTLLSILLQPTALSSATGSYGGFVTESRRYSAREI